VVDKPGEGPGSCPVSNRMRPWGNCSMERRSLIGPRGRHDASPWDHPAQTRGRREWAAPDGRKSLRGEHGIADVGDAARAPCCGMLGGNGWSAPRTVGGPALAGQAGRMLPGNPPPPATAPGIQRRWPTARCRAALTATGDLRGRAQRAESTARGSPKRSGASATDTKNEHSGLRTVQTSQATGRAQPKGTD